MHRSVPFCRSGFLIEPILLQFSGTERLFLTQVFGLNLTGNCSFRNQRVLDRYGYGQAKKCLAFDKIGNARDYQGREAGIVFWRCCFRLRGQTQAGAKPACN
jgi:hypothetical protein